MDSSQTTGWIVALVMFLISLVILILIIAVGVYLGLRWNSNRKKKLMNE